MRDFNGRDGLLNLLHERSREFGDVGILESQLPQLVPALEIGEIDVELNGTGV